MRCGPHYNFRPLCFQHRRRLCSLVLLLSLFLKNAFYLWDQDPHGLRQEFVYPVRVALQQYVVSPNAAAVHTYEAGFSHWIPGSAKRSQKVELIDTIIEVVLQHRLCM